MACLLKRLPHRSLALISFRSLTFVNRASPLSLPREQQHEFEELCRAAQSAPSQLISTEADLTLHPDARRPLQPDFEGDVNPSTGERGGPKKEPVTRWSEEGGDWSFKGRVSDF